MPKGILKFKLPEENAEFKTACNAGDLYCRISETLAYIRNELKHAELTKEERKRLEYIIDILYEYNINI